MSNEPTNILETPSEEEERYVDEHYLVVECPHCGHECIWINTEYGWILCNAESGSEEPVIHHCPVLPDYINVDEEDESNAEKTTVV